MLAVTIDREFAGAIEDGTTRSKLLRSLGVAFGSRLVVGASPLSREMKLTKSLRANGAALLAFDVFVHNIDRRLQNPNVLVTRDGLVAIDHELSFGFTGLVIGAPDPVEDHCQSIVDGHALRPHVRKARASLADVRARIEALDDRFFDGIALATPVEWTSGPAVGKLEAVLDVMRRRRDAALRWIPLVETCMNK